MAELTITVPDSAFAIAMITVALDASGHPTIVTATEYPYTELESLGRASLPTAVRRYADELAEDAPKVITLPASDDENDDWDDDEEHNHPTEKKD